MDSEEDRVASAEEVRRVTGVTTEAAVASSHSLTMPVNGMVVRRVAVADRISGASIRETDVRRPDQEIDICRAMRAKRLRRVANKADTATRAMNHAISAAEGAVPRGSTGASSRVADSDARALTLRVVSQASKERPPV